MQQTVLITGTGRPYALGFNLVKRCLERGDRVFASIRRPSEALEALRGEYPDRLHILTMDIASTDFDYPGLSTEILAFCQLQLLSPALIRNIQLAVEELVLQTILPALGEDAVPMKLSLEYSDADMSTELLLQYGGRAYNPLKEGDELSLRIVKSVAEEWSYEYREQNYLRMRFRQKD